jgi:hypothetical protein
VFSDNHPKIPAGYPGALAKAQKLSQALNLLSIRLAVQMGRLQFVRAVLTYFLLYYDFVSNADGMSLALKLMLQKGARLG